jgi:type IV secretion system protein TrbC
MFNSRRLIKVLKSCPVAFFVFVSSAFAAGSGMPWESRLDDILSSISGPVVRVIGLIAIIACGCGIAFSESGGGMRKFLWVVLGLTIAFNAASWILSWLGYSGGLLI